MMGFGSGMGLFGLFWILLFWGGVIALAVWLIRLLFPSVQKSEEGEKATLSAQEILRSRYAQGELTTGQYQEMRQNLSELPTETYNM